MSGSALETSLTSVRWGKVLVILLQIDAKKGGLCQETSPSGARLPMARKADAGSLRE